MESSSLREQPGRRRVPSVRGTLPPLPALSETANFSDPFFAVLAAEKEKEREEDLLGKEVRALAPSYLHRIGWHLKGMSALIGDSSEAGRYFSQVDGGLGEEELVELWKAALSHSSRAATLARMAAPQLVGVLEETNKSLVAAWLQDEDEGGVSDIGATGGRPLTGLSQRQILMFSHLLALVSLFLNSRYTDSYDHAKRGRPELPFPAGLADLGKEAQVHHLFSVVYNLEFLAQEDRGMRIGELALFLWAYSLSFTSDQTVKGFRPPTSMAHAANALLCVIKYTILYFRTLHAPPSDVDMKRLSFQQARSSASIAVLRRAVNSEIGKERRESVFIDHVESARLQLAVANIIKSGAAPLQVNAVHIGGAVQRAHADLQRLSADVFRLVGLDSGLVDLLSSPIEGGLNLDVGYGDLARIILPHQDYRTTFDLLPLFAEWEESADEDSKDIIKDKASRMQVALLTAVYWSHFGASRAPDLLYVSRLSRNHKDAVQAVDSADYVHPVELYHSEACSPRQVKLVMGCLKTAREVAHRGLPRFLDPRTSLHLALFNFIRLALQDTLPQSDFHSNWMFPSSERLRYAFEEGSRLYFGSSFGIAEARQVTALSGFHLSSFPWLIVSHKDTLPPLSPFPPFSSPFFQTPR